MCHRCRRQADRWLPHVEVIAYRRGVAWVVDRLVELVKKHDAELYCDDISPAASLIPDLERESVHVTRMGTKDVLVATASLYDAIQAGTLRCYETEEMAAAVATAARRSVGESWAWSRKLSTADATPLVAASLALFGLQQERPSVGIWDLNEVAAQMRARQLTAEDEDDEEDELMARSHTRFHCIRCGEEGPQRRLWKHRCPGEEKPAPLEELAGQIPERPEPPAAPWLAARPLDWGMNLDIPTQPKEQPQCLRSPHTRTPSACRRAPATSPTRRSPPLLPHPATFMRSRLPAPIPFSYPLSDLAGQLASST